MMLMMGHYSRPELLPPLLPVLEPVSAEPPEV